MIITNYYCIPKKMVKGCGERVTAVLRGGFRSLQKDVEPQYGRGVFKWLEIRKTSE